MKILYLASGNTNKKKELQEILPDYKIILPKEEGIEFYPIEDGKTFFDNAMIKAKALFDIVKKPVIADDSGLCIDYLNGAPGVYSARYGLEDGKDISGQVGINKVLQKLAGIKNRKAHFTCCIVLLFDYNRFFSAQQICEGSITEKIHGDGGFAYDPIFFVEKYAKTFAELSSEEKNTISHRGLAIKQIAKLM